MAEYTQTYWNELIDKYRNGTISDKDRFQLEKEALDDPFLFDALEGYALHDDAQQDKKEEKKSAKIFTLSRIAVAASVVFLVAVMFNLNSNKGTQLESDNAIAMVLDGDEKEISEMKTKAEVESKDGAISTAEEKMEPKPNASKNKKQSPPAVTEGNWQDANNNSNRVQKESAPVASKPIQDIVKIEKKELGKAEIESEESADVIDEKRSEMAAATNEPAAVEESMTQVQLESDDLANAGTLDKVVQKDKKEAVIMDSDLDMSGAKSDKKKRAKVASFYEAVPVIGKEIFDDFAKESIDKRGLRQEKPQEVTIEFKIDKNGNLTDFHHIFTGCPECGPYAISLLQKSGEWKTIPPGYSGKARYTFIF